MVKLVFCLRRLEEMSREEFQRYWRETHGPLVRSHAAVLGIRRYVQVHTAGEDVNDMLRASRDAPEPYDGVAELWWDSSDDFTAGLANPDALAAAQELLEDERKFIDHARSPIFVAQEHAFVELGDR